MIWFILGHLFSSLLSIFNLTQLSDPEKDLEILILRHPLAILQRKLKHPVKPSRFEKMTLAVLVVKLKHFSRKSANHFSDLVLIFQPETIFRWHRDLVRRKWTFYKKNKGGRPPLSKDTKNLILQISARKPPLGLWQDPGRTHQARFCFVEI